MRLDYILVAMGSHWKAFRCKLHVKFALRGGGKSTWAALFHGEWTGGGKSGKKELQFRWKDSTGKIDWDFTVLLLKNRTENILYLAEFVLKLIRFLSTWKEHFSVKNNINGEESDEDVSDFSLLNIKWNFKKDCGNLVKNFK